MPKDRAYDSKRVAPVGGNQPDVLKGLLTDTNAEWKATMSSIPSNRDSDSAYDSDQKNSRRFDEGYKGII
jgi:hypothetical protein